MLSTYFPLISRNHKESTMIVLELLCLTLISYKCHAIDIDDIALSDCSSYEGCEDTTNTQIGTPTFSQSSSAAAAVVSEADIDTGSVTTEYTKDNAKTTSTLQTTDKQLATTVKPEMGTTIMNNIEQTPGLVKKNYSNICMCDVTISSCDINCCCDVDCNDFQLSVFSHCDDHHPKMYDSRYCYTKNFIQRNNTRFILERLASNLFCIAYDNLPPVYGISNVPDITNRNTFEDAKRAVDRNKNTWDWHHLVVHPEFNFSRRYHDTDFVWKFQSNYVNLIQLPQSGLTSKCTFGKSLKYLERYKSMCMQTDLRNNNSYLFTEMYENFTVIASPHLFNASYAKEENHICPKNVCVPVRSLYCTESSDQCNSTKPLEQSCSNGFCRNVLKRIRYTIVHNGTDGIQRIDARFELTDISQSFYQYFEVTYEWANEDGRHIFLRSGNHGYTIGNPIITGVLFTNIVNGAKTEYININRPNYYLTVPMRRKNGYCDSRQRYIVGFGEDIRLTCNVELKTNNFSSDSCMDLQNQTLKLLLEDSLENVTAANTFKTFVSKMGDILINDTSNWTQIILDRIPSYVVTGQVYDNRLRCSGLITSLHLEILHTILPKPEDTNNYKIAGVSATFSEPIDISWTKCLGTNCTDTLKVGVLTLVSFTDVSTPSMYYYAGGPNLDLSLPYDFFYPFMSSAGNAEPLISLLGILSVSIIINSIYNLCTLL